MVIRKYQFTCKTKSSEMGIYDLETLGDNFYRLFSFFENKCSVVQASLLPPRSSIVMWFVQAIVFKQRLEVMFYLVLSML